MEMSNIIPIINLALELLLLYTYINKVWRCNGMKLIKKILTIANLKANQIIEETNNSQTRTPLIKKDELLNDYKLSNDRIDQLRASIRNTKL